MGWWLILLAGGGADALAQGFDGQRHTPPAGSAGGLAVERAAVSGSGSVALYASFAWNPVIFRRNGEIIARPLQSIGVFDVMGSIGLVDRLELGISLPVAPVYDGDPLTRAEYSFEAGPGFGDLRLVPKLVILGDSDEDSLRLGLAVPIRVPTGDEDALRGSGEAAIEPMVLLGGEIGPFGIHGSTGFRFRPGLDEADLVGQEFTYGLALALSPIDRKQLGLDVMLEMFGAIDVDRPGPERTDYPLEILGGVGLRPARGLTITAAAGPGLTDGLGTPDARFVLGVRFSADPDDDQPKGARANQTPRRPQE